MKTVSHRSAQSAQRDLMTSLCSAVSSVAIHSYENRCKARLKSMVRAENGGTRGVVLAIIALVTSLIGVSLSRLVYPYDVGYYEAAVWEPSLLAANGLNPYNYALRPPFVMAPYGYLYYLMIGLGLSLFGLQLWLWPLM